MKKYDKTLSLVDELGFKIKKLEIPHLENLKRPPHF